MKVAVKLFAAARELAGAPEAIVDAAPGATVGDVRRRLAAQCPELASLAARSLLAVNAEYASDATTLAEGDEVALIPPVSGG
jgi:molybdopterin converting factor subunit 1